MGTYIFWKLVIVYCFVAWISVCDGGIVEGSQEVTRRWQRQSGDHGCSGDRFHCISGECIDKLSVCDGSLDCSDQSDETEDTCQNEDCPSYAFRCNYGGCVDINSKCDGKDDCADRSDETLTECNQHCRVDEFTCSSDGTCIDALLLCDGKSDCEDGTDETMLICADISCPAYAFHCKYGACIDRTKMCDGKVDCIDSSDEARSLCRSETVTPTKPATTRPNGARPQPVTAKPVAATTQNIEHQLDISQVTAKPPKPTKATPTVSSQTPDQSCPLPQPILNGKFTIGGCEANDPSPLCRAVMGTAALISTILLHTCDSGYTLTGSTFSVCQGNMRWVPSLPTCLQKLVSCPALVDVSIEIACSHTGKAVNCTQPMVVGTEARLKCNEGYALANEPNYRKIVCLAKGEWDRPLFTCIPDCGKRNPNGRPFISNGEVAQIGEYPWHAGIYQKNSTGGFNQVCGGTLITAKLVISAAHCFWDEVYSKKFSQENYKIALGKFFRDWDHIDDEMQKIDIEEILIEERYRGRKRNFQFDIAILRLQKPAELTWAVNIVCVDWDNELERFQLAPGQNGTVTGWGITEENQPSPVLKSVQLPYVELFPTCYNTVAETFQPYLTSDKFCAGYTNNRTSVCPGDSGGGLVFQHATTKRYYLRGIVSVGSKPDTNTEKCYTQAFTAFSKFSESLKWVEQYQYT